jgi:hypothetical protein
VQGIDRPAHSTRHRTRKDSIMTTRIAPRLYAVASAAFFTLLMLAGIQSLATSEAPAGQLARAAAQQHA